MISTPRSRLSAAEAEESRSALIRRSLQNVQVGRSSRGRVTDAMRSAVEQRQQMEQDAAQMRSDLRSSASMYREKSMESRRAVHVLRDMLKEAGDAEREQLDKIRDEMER